MTGTIVAKRGPAAKVAPAPDANSPSEAPQLKRSRTA